MATLAQGGTTTSYEYDAQQQRLKQTTGGSTIVYLNDPVTGIGAELHPGSGGTWHDYLMADGERVGMRISTTSPVTSNWQVYIQDHQGSVAVVTDITGAVTQRLGYDAWGRRRQPNGTDDPAGSITAPTSRGYTDHEHVPGSLINMNGRMFDPEVGRFLSADPVIPSLYRTQAQNRYSYVYNNPGRYTDPNGYQPASDIPVITVTGSRYDSSTYGPPHNSWFGSYYFVGFDSDFWPGYVSWGGGSLASPGRHMPPGLASTIQSLRQTKPLGDLAPRAPTVNPRGGVPGVVQIIGRRAGDKYGNGGSTGAFRYAQETTIQIGYTVVTGDKHHAFVIATDSSTGERMITRAGPKASGWGLSGASTSSVAGGSFSAASGNAGSGGFGFGPIEARVAIWSEALRFDRPSDTVYIQEVGSVNLPYDSVVSQMNSFAQSVNNNNIPYWPLGPNSNSYAFSFVESLGLDRPSPALSAPGAGKAIK